jgi:hypothetical protein
MPRAAHLLLAGFISGWFLLMVAAPVRPPVRSAVLPKVHFADIAARAGLTVRTEVGGEHSKKYIIETTGSGAVFFDYDNDEWLDIFLVNGTTLEGFPH